jgi:hypothetical protein
MTTLDAPSAGVSAEQHSAGRTLHKAATDARLAAQRLRLAVFAALDAGCSWEQVGASLGRHAPAEQLEDLRRRLEPSYTAWVRLGRPTLQQLDDTLAYRTRSPAR